MIEQPKLDANLQPNQLELIMHNKTPAVVVLYLTAILHTCINSKAQQKVEVPSTYSIQGSIQSANILQSVQLRMMCSFRPNHLSTDSRHL